MEDTDAPASARIAAARTSLELAGDIGKHSQSQRNYEQNLYSFFYKLNTFEHY